MTVMPTCYASLLKENIGRFMGSSGSPSKEDYVRSPMFSIVSWEFLFLRCNFFGHVQLLFNRDKQQTLGKEGWNDLYVNPGLRCL